LIVAVLFLATSGCSWSLVQKAPADPVDATTTLTCTSSPAAPILDTVVATASVAVALLNEPSISKNCQSDVCSSGVSYINLGLLVNAAVFGVSAYHGYKSTGECRELRKMQVHCGADASPGCSMLKGSDQPDPGEPVLRAAERRLKLPVVPFVEPGAPLSAQCPAP